MIILNAMFAKGLGGIEQAFIDYTEALALKGHTVICITHPKAQVKKPLENLKQRYPNIIHYSVSNFGKWDPVSKLLLLRIVKKHLPDAMIAHGNRPAGLLAFVAGKCPVPLVGVVHNYWFKDIMKCKYLFCVSSDIRAKIASRFFGADRVYKIPNLIRIGAEPQFKPFGTPVKIGMMARFVEKKGVDIFLKALDILNKKQIKFIAEIAGDGELREKLQALRDELKLNDKVQFTGWVKDKNKFYNDIDIFCLPSLSEPFGIVLLEAMNFKKPMIATDIEGPKEILENNITALLFDKGNYTQLAEGLEELIMNHQKAANLAEKAFWVAKNGYDLPIVAEILENTLEKVVRNY